MPLIKVLFIFAFIGVLLYSLFRYKNKWLAPKESFPEEWKKILKANVFFYAQLNHEEKELFEYKVQEFLLNCKITGVETTAELLDRLLIASSAVIPIFAFPEWKYKNLNEVLLYPGSFNHDFDTKGKGRNILGMVGTGYMKDKMILSKIALRHGFKNEKDKKNVAIHEFVHLIDGMDGEIDGIPMVLLEKQYMIPWLDMIERKIEDIVKRKSDIHPYAKTSRIEFFAVIGEYFFERPYLLKKKHPKLYEILEEIFDQDLSAKKRWIKK